MHATIIPQLWHCLAKRFDATVHQMTPRHEFGPHASYIDWAYCWLDSREIWLGYYEDAAARELFFFHELGHAAIEYAEVHGETHWFGPVPAGTDRTVQEERQAWDVGLELARRNGVEFSPETLAWVDYAVESYKSLDSVENSVMKQA